MSCPQGAMDCLCSAIVAFSGHHNFFFAIQYSSTYFQLTLRVPEPYYSQTGRACANKIVPDQTAPRGAI